MTWSTLAPPRAAAIALTLALAIALPVSAASASSKPKPLVTLSQIEPDFMCPTCHEPLQVAQSSQADRERAYLSTLIAQGKTESQIKAALVGAYGPTVLSVPNAQGFDLTLFIVPPALLLAGLASLAVILPRWRRRARAAAAQAIPAGPGLDEADTMRLDQELARYKG